MSIWHTVKIYFEIIFDNIGNKFYRCNIFFTDINSTWCFLQWTFDSNLISCKTELVADIWLILFRISSAKSILESDETSFVSFWRCTGIPCFIKYLRLVSTVDKLKSATESISIDKISLGSSLLSKISLSQE